MKLATSDESTGQESPSKKGSGPRYGRAPELPLAADEPELPLGLGSREPLAEGLAEVPLFAEVPLHAKVLPDDDFTATPHSTPRRPKC